MKFDVSMDQVSAAFGAKITGIGLPAGHGRDAPDGKPAELVLYCEDQAAPAPHPGTAALDEALAYLIRLRSNGGIQTYEDAKSTDAFLSRPDIASRVAGMGKGERRG